MMNLRFFLLLCFLSIPTTLPATGAQQSYSLTVKDAQPALKEALANAGAGEDVRATIFGMNEDQVLAQASEPLSVSVEDMRIDQAVSRWQAMLLFKSGTRNLAPVRVNGRYTEITLTPVLNRRVMSGEVIEEGDIAWAEHPAARLRKNTVMDIKALVGKTPRRMISPGRPVRQDEIGSPAVLLKGARITLLYRAANLEIKTIGEALEGGAEGDMIRVRNLTSKAIITAKVESAERARVYAPGAETAELIP